MARTGDGPESKPMKKCNLSGMYAHRKRLKMKRIAIVVCLLAMVLATAVAPSPAYAQQTTSDADTVPTIVGPAVVRMTGVQAAEANACTQLSPVSITPPPDEAMAAQSWGDNPVFLPLVNQGEIVSGPVCPVVAIGSDFMYTGQSLVLQAAPGNVPVDAYLESLGVGTISYVPITNTLDFEKYASLMITGTLASATANLKLKEVWKLESFGTPGVQAAEVGQLPPDPSWWEYTLFRALDDNWDGAFGFELRADDRVHFAVSDPGTLFGLLCPQKPTAQALYLGSMVVPRGAITEIWSLIKHQGCYASQKYVWVNKLTMLSIMRRPEHRVIYKDVYAKSLVYAKAYNAEVYVSQTDGSLILADDATLQALVWGSVVIVSVVLVAATTQQYYILVFVVA